MKKKNKIEIWSAQGIALILIIIIAGYFGYNYITKILAYSALVPNTYSIDQQLPTGETVLYRNINKEKYGIYDYIVAQRGELIVQLKDWVPLYRIAQIAEQYGLQVDRKYLPDSPSYVLRIVDPGDDIGSPTMRIVDPGDDIGSYSASDLRKQGYQIDPNVKYNTRVSSGYLESIWQQLESRLDIYSVTLNTAK